MVGETGGFFCHPGGDELALSNLSCWAVSLGRFLGEALWSAGLYLRPDPLWVLSAATAGPTFLWKNKRLRCHKTLDVADWCKNVAKE